MKLLFILLLGLGFTQTNVTSKMISYNLDINGNEIIDVSIADMIGDNIDRGSIDFIGFEGEIDDFLLVSYGTTDGFGNLVESIASFYLHQSNGATTNDAAISYYFDTKVNNLRFHYQANTALNFNGILYFIVSADFPEEDTGYIEEGFEYCLTPPVSLISFPCDNPINITQSLPQGAENFITEIVGEGIAAKYDDSLGWIGNLAEFTPGSGYWFKSNESLCFEYDCVED